MPLRKLEGHRSTSEGSRPPLTLSSAGWPSKWCETAAEPGPRQAVTDGDLDRSLLAD